MLHFNDLKYYAVPTLPKSWKAPSWLKIELGIFAGRLYFEYEECAGLCAFLGVQDADGKLAETDLDETNSSDEQSAEKSGDEQSDDGVDNNDVHGAISQQIRSFTRKPLTFLHEWLAVRRKGQDFAHTPMGYVCQGKPLTANHPFIAKVDTNGSLKAETLVERMRKEGTAAVAADAGADVTEDDEGFDEDVYYEDGVDDVKDTM
jgi:hypothetical protein